MERVVYNINCQVSDKLPAGTSASVQDRLTGAENVVLCKDTEDDYRACVSFNAQSVTVFTSNATTRPDPCMWNDRSQCKLHYDQTDITFLETLQVKPGVCWDNDWHKILIDWDASTTDWLERAIAHEIGHGVGLHHQTHSPPELMHGGYLAAGHTILKNTDVDEYDGGPVPAADP